MPLERFDYAGILADLKAKRSALDTLIAAHETAQSIGALGQPGAATAANGGNFTEASDSVELPVGAFLNKSVPAAIKLYLSAVKRKQTNQQITAALKEGGVESTGSLAKVVTGTLQRLRSAAEVLRFKDGWGLAEHYNESFRARLAHNQKPARANSKAKRKAKPKAAKAKKAAEVGSEPAPTKKKGDQAAIETYFTAHPGEELTTKAIATELGIRVQTVALICSKLAHQGRLERTAAGGFRMAKVHAMPKAV